MSSEATHTFGRECRLAPVSQLETDPRLAGIPPLKAHFFYSSPIPIDDPLSTATIGGHTDSRSSKGILRPFSPGDNNDLERAWLGFASARHKQEHAQARLNSGSSLPPSQGSLDKLENIIHQLASKHKDIHEREGLAAAPELEMETPETLPQSGVAVCCAELLIDTSAELRKEFCALVRKQEHALDQDKVIQRVVATFQRLRSNAEALNETHSQPGLSKAGDAAGSQGPAVELKTHTRISGVVEKEGTRCSDCPQILPAADMPRAIPVRPPVVDDGISGKPFIRVGVDDTLQPSPPASLPKSPPSLNDSSSPAHARRIEPKETQHEPPKVANPRSGVSDGNIEESADVPVGISRLHMVSLPVLQMKPIYWSPVNDIAIVMRATWFYR